MRIIGIDPGYAITGYALIDYDGQTITVLDYGTLETTKATPFAERLLAISDGVDELIRTWTPTVMACEELFFTKNKTTALGTAQARGVALASAARYGVEVFEYTPNAVKKAVTGSGRAAKEQVQLMVQTLLKLEEVPKPDDAADALALCICQALTGRMRSYEALGGYQKSGPRNRGSNRW